MISSIESRLWLAVHLLYSNASQAFDVYQAVILQSEHSIANNDVLVVFARLFQVYEKIPAIGSSLAFYEFEFEEIDQWKIIYKNSQKTQLIIFIGVLIFELKIQDIAQVMKLNPEKTQFLFHQIFKKLASSSQKLKYNEQLEFKKQNDNKISYLFTYENLVDYCLNQLSDEDTEKVKNGLKLYPMLQIAKEEYSRIISQIQNLKVQKERAVINSDAKPNLKIVNNEVTSDQYSAKGLTKNQMRMLMVIGGLLSLLILIQPIQYLKRLNQNDHTVVLQEVEKNNNDIALNTEPEVKAEPDKKEDVMPEVSAGQQVVVAKSDTDVKKTASNESKNNLDQKVASQNDVANSNSQIAQAEKEASVNNPNVDVKNLVTQVEKIPNGGLFRGTLHVSQLSDSNQKIKEKINALGAIKAGEVELGWLKTPKWAYYHYTIPEKNMAEVEVFLRQIGVLQIKFETHPRKLPIGTRRFIIEVKEN